MDGDVRCVKPLPGVLLGRTGERDLWLLIGQELVEGNAHVVDALLDVHHQLIDIARAGVGLFELLVIERDATSRR